ncbi:hypothetical protein [Aestuariivivens insulae]|uniref:hypothetical protein n=1 Tax=Aestuariivivens insulae TaxID=1621988 RepID=UPI001F5AEB99|nr:hypothetical protein [Aestuariivivens insulae]
MDHTKHQKKITAEGSTGSKSKYLTMKSYQNIQKGSGTKKNQKRKTLLDTISKSLNINPVYFLVDAKSI